MSVNPVQYQYGENSMPVNVVTGSCATPSDSSAYHQLLNGLTYSYNPK